MSQHAPRYRRPGLRAVLSALVASALLAGPAAALLAAPAAAASDDGRRSFGVQPAGPKKPDSRPNFTYRDVKPGARFYDHVAFVNISDQPVTLSIYPADAFNTSNGAFDLKKPHQKSDDVGAWVSLIRNKVTVPARSAWVTPVTVTVPKNAEPGDHAGGIVASLRTQTKDAKGNSVTVDSRVASRVYVRVTGQLRPHLTLDKPQASYVQKFFGLGFGDGRVKYTVRNDGNVRLVGDQTVRVSTLLGTSHQAKNLPKLPEILPGGEFSFTATAHTVLPTFLVNGEVTIDPQSVAGNVDPATAQVSGNSWFWALYWPLLVIILLALGEIGRRYRNRRNRRSEAPGAAGPAGPGGSGGSDGPGGGSAPNDAARIPAALMVAGVLTLGGLLGGVAGAAPAQAASNGDLTFIPGKGMDISPMYAVTSQGCPAEATNVIGHMTGKGFPDPTLIIQNSDTDMAHDGAFGVPLGDTLSGFAQAAGVKLSGPYEVTLKCINPTGRKVYAQFTGTVTFGDATHFTAPTPKVPPNVGVPMGFLAQVFPEFKQGPGPSATIQQGQAQGAQSGAGTPVGSASGPKDSTSTFILPFFLVIAGFALVGALAVVFTRPKKAPAGKSIARTVTKPAVPSEPAKPAEQSEQTENTTQSTESEDVAVTVTAGGDKA